MSQSDYSTKMQAMLIDRDTYQPLTKDPTTSLDNKMNRIQMKLRQEEHLLEQTYHQLRSSAGRVPRLYGLRKIHKPDIPFRPIVSFLSSPTYIRTIKVPSIPAETCGGSLPSPCEELTTLCALHQVTTPGERGDPGVLWCSVIVHACPNWSCFRGVPKVTGEWSLPTTQDWTQRGWDLFSSHLCLEDTYLMLKRESTNKSTVQPWVQLCRWW